MLASMTFFSHFPLERTTSRIPDRQANKSRAHPEPKFWWIPLLGKQSNPVSRQDVLLLPESGTIFWSNLGSRKYPPRPWPTYSTRPLIPPTTQATSGSRISIRVPLARPFLPGGVLGISSDGDDLRIFLGLKFSIPGFVWVWKFDKYFFG